MFKPLKAKRTFELVIDLLKEKIFTGEYGPGDRLPSERELSDLLQIGRPTIREAFRALELSGIIEIRKGHNGGAFIQRPGHSSITQTIRDMMILKTINLTDLAEARRFLEKDIAEIAAKRAKPADIKKLDKIVKDAFLKLKEGVPAIEEGIAFHLTLSEAAGNPVMMLIHCSIMELLHLFIKTISPDVETSLMVTKEHEKMVEALRKRDSKLLQKLIDTHIQWSNQRLMEISKKRAI